MFEDYLNHTCDIYHLKDDSVNISYGIKAAAVRAMPEEPDETGVRCHFHVKSSTLSIVQNEPQTNLDGYVKLTLPFDTDIRMNDYVKDCESGFFYRAGIPKVIHGGHHKIVNLTRDDNLKGAV